MAKFSTSLIIQFDFRALIKEIERYFKITLKKEVIQKIFSDALKDQVTEKEYLIFEGMKKNLSREMRIRGNVDEYEPETIYIEIQNIKEKDVKHFNELFSDGDNNLTKKDE